MRVWGDAISFWVGRNKTHKTHAEAVAHMTVCIHECKGRTCSADAAFLHRSSAGAGHNLFTTQIEILTSCANSVCLTALCNNSFARHIHLRRCRNKLPTAAKQGLHCKAPLHVSGLPCSMDAGSRHRTVNLACVRFRKFSWPSLPTACIQLPQSSKPGCKSYHAWCPEHLPGGFAPQQAR